jgi:hypothetical protein
LRSLPFTKIYDVVFHLKKYLRSSSNYTNIWGRLPFTKIFEVIFHFKNIWGRLPFTKIFEVVFHLTYKIICPTCIKGACFAKLCFEAVLKLTVRPGRIRNSDNRASSVQLPVIASWNWAWQQVDFGMKWKVSEKKVFSSSCNYSTPSVAKMHFCFIHIYFIFTTQKNHNWRALMQHSVSKNKWYACIRWSVCGCKIIVWLFVLSYLT